MQMVTKHITQMVSATYTLVARVAIHINMSLINMVSGIYTEVTQVFIDTNMSMTQMFSDTDS